jgi:hypothetical protein
MPRKPNGCFYSPNPLPNQVLAGSAFQALLEAVALILGSNSMREWHGSRPYVRLDVNNAVHLVLTVATFAKLLSDTETPLLPDPGVDMQGTVHVSIHPPEFHLLVFRTDAVAAGVQQAVSGYVEAVLEVFMYLHGMSYASAPERAIFLGNGIVHDTGFACMYE